MENSAPSRDLLVQQALSYVPHLTHLVDRNPLSPTYGCFDREYWHYRTLDFPCGMSQEFVLPFALLYKNPYPGNPWYGVERMREIAEAGIRFAMKSSRKDGTCDDYYPYERAMGALVFSTYAAAESYRLLKMDNPEIVEFFDKRCRHLAAHNETGRLSNHQALTALAAYTVYEITGDSAHKKLAEERAELTTSWQHPEEGWFQEYEGADPGYHSCSIAFLGKYLKKSQDERLIEPLKKAVEFAAYFMHPDGSYGGEYGSRNTYHFYPHGFEVMAPFTPLAAQVNDLYLRGLTRGKRYHLDDDRLCCHLVYDWLQAWEDWHPHRPEEKLEERPNFEKWMPHAGLAVTKKDRYYAVANLRKGGVTKVYDEEGCLGSDTGLLIKTDEGKTLTPHLMDEEHQVAAEPEKNTFTVEGRYAVAKRKLAAPHTLIAFRLINLTFGRFFPNLLRFLLQKILITGKNRSPWRFRRELEFREDGVHIADHLPDAIPAEEMALSSDATSIYVAASNCYQESVLRCGWVHGTTAQLERVRLGNFTWKRCIGPREQ